MYDERSCRYNVHGNPPRNLEGIFWGIARSVRRRGFLHAGNARKEIRSIIENALGKGANRGEADDGFRFLENYNILLTEGERVWYDAKRAEVILQYSITRTVPPNPIPCTDRIAELKAQFTSATTEIPPPPSPADPTLLARAKAIRVRWEALLQRVKRNRH